MTEPSLHTLLQHNHHVLLMVIDALPFPVFFKDKDGCYLGCNSACEELFNYKRSDIIGKNASSIFGGSSANVFEAADHELLKNPGAQVYETSFQHTDGREIHLKFEKATFLDEDGNVAGIIGAAIDISKEKKLEAKLQHLASYDDLTGIYNRREGRKYLKSICKDAVRKSRPASVLLVDLDNFKHINDTYGHDSGDIILKAVAACLQGQARETDLICRYGGEEFLIVLPETSLEEALTIANRHREALAQCNVAITQAESLSITASFGAAQLDMDFADIELMLKQADLALYRAKAKGKNCVCT